MRAFTFRQVVIGAFVADVHAAFEKRFGVPLIETMGLTETAAQNPSQSATPKLSKIGSPGIGFGNEVIIGNEVQQEQPRDTEGEILVRGNNVLRHYLKNPEATRDTIHQRRLGSATGDLGRYGCGRLCFRDRTAEGINYQRRRKHCPPRGRRSPIHPPDVVEAAAFAVHCANYGQRLEAAVRLTQDSK